MPQLHVISARPVTVSVTGKVRPRKRNAADPLQQAIDKTPAGPLLDALDFGKKKRKKTAAKKRRKAKAKRTRRRNPSGWVGGPRVSVSVFLAGIRMHPMPGMLKAANLKPTLAQAKFPAKE